MFGMPMIVALLIAPAVVCTAYISSCFIFKGVAAYEERTDIMSRLYGASIIGLVIGFMCASFGVFK